MILFDEEERQLDKLHQQYLEAKVRYLQAAIKMTDAKIERLEKENNNG